MLSLLLAVSLATTVRPQMVVSTEWLADNLRNPNVRVLDVTTPAEYKSGHIAGAVFLSVNRLMVRRNGVPNEMPSVAQLEELFRDAGLKPTERIILTSNDPLLAARAWLTLDYLGWGDYAAILDGGNAKWTGERRLVNTIITPVKRGELIATVEPKAIISRADLKTLLASGEEVALLDARDTAHYLGNLRGPEVENGGHIPNAECMPWDANLARQGRFRVLREPGQLAEMYASLNVTKRQRIVVYCRTGVEASMTYFVLRYLGFRPALYDGSFVDWNKTEPVARAMR